MYQVMRVPRREISSWGRFSYDRVSRLRDSVGCKVFLTGILNKFGLNLRLDSSW
jgi:hypothetical protein